MHKKVSRPPNMTFLGYFEGDLMTIMHRAHETYLEEMKKKEDGRPDFAARKACNYLEDAIEVIQQWNFFSMYVATP